MKITDEELVYIVTEVSIRFSLRIRQAHKQSRLESFLKDIGMEDLLTEVGKEGRFESFPDGKIVVIGGSHISAGEIYSCFMRLGIPKERVDLLLDYNKFTNLDLGYLQYNPMFRLVIAGPTPHSGRGIGDHSSIIARLEEGSGFPKVIRLSNAHGLKITKTALTKAIMEQLEDGYLKV